MPSRQSKSQKATVERVMHEFKEGELRTRGTGPKVKNPKQAIAIALHEAGASNRESPGQNRRSLARSKAKEASGKTAEAQKEGKRAQDRTLAKGTAAGKPRQGKPSLRKASQAKSSRAESSRPRSSPAGQQEAGKTRSALYAEARRRGIPGRSRMSKAALQRALGH